MAQRTYDPNRTQEAYTEDVHVAERPNEAWKMLLPFIVGLLVGWGIGEVTDRDVVETRPADVTPGPGLGSPDMATPSRIPSSTTPGTVTPGTGPTGTTAPPLENP